MRNPAVRLSYSLLPIAAAFLLSNCAGVEPFRNVACFQAAKVSLQTAVVLAEKQGGQAIDARYRQNKELGCLERDPGVYDVALLLGNTMRTVSVDADSGAVGPKKGDPVPDLGKRVIEQIIVGDHEAKADAVPELSIGIEQATDIAERDGGKAMAAWADTDDGRAGYRVKVVEDGKTRIEWVDGERGFARAPRVAPNIERRG